MAKQAKAQAQKVSDLIAPAFLEIYEDPNAQTRKEIIAAIRASGRVISETQAQRVLARMIEQNKVAVVRVRRRNASGVLRPVEGYRVVE